MADAYRQMQKQLCLDGAPNGGHRKYGCRCCRKFGNKNYFKKWSRRLARKMLKRVPDDLLTCRK